MALSADSIFTQHLRNCFTTFLTPNGCLVRITAYTWDAVACVLLCIAYNRSLLKVVLPGASANC